MKILVLGAAAGGGLPQWNCGCRNCADARAGIIPPQTQSALAASGAKGAWVLLNASPDIRDQLARAPALRPAGLRGTPIEAVVLTNGDVDHVAGLLTLREKTGFELYATPEILDALSRNPIFGVLDPTLVTRRPVALGGAIDAAGMRIETFAVPGKVPLYQEAGEVKTAEIGETTIGLRLSAGGRIAYYIPGCAAVPDDLLARLADADLLLFDGTVWENDEMPRLGAGAKTGLRMGHSPISGPEGSLERLSGIKARKIYIHINNTNPIFQPDSPERQVLKRSGWEVAADGMEIEL
ncbi:MAG: pyrroloquinoline quinone biosynthesis protein PqqB [Paracoccaceae bacterium]